MINLFQVSDKFHELSVVTGVGNSVLTKSLTQCNLKT